MKTKYLNDYRLDYQLSPGGGLKSVPVYIGQRFRLKLAPEALAVLKRRLAVLVVLSAALLLVLLMGTTLLVDAFSLLGISMGFSLIPLWLMARAVWVLHTAEMPTTRKKKDQITMQYPGGSWFFMIMSCITGLGLLAQMIIKPVRAVHWLYTADALALSLCSVLLFLLRKPLVMEAVPETEALEAPEEGES